MHLVRWVHWGLARAVEIADQVPFLFFESRRQKEERQLHEQARRTKRLKNSLTPFLANDIFDKWLGQYDTVPLHPRCFANRQNMPKKNV